MFGYVVINKSELKFKEYDVYKSYYCGLCHSLKSHYGLKGQITLTYDMTFLAMLLTSLYEPKITQSKHRCMVHPLKPQSIISSTYTDYVADMNVLLAYYKALDDWNDDKNLLKLAFAKIIKPKELKKNASVSNANNDLNFNEDCNDSKKENTVSDRFDYATKANAIASLLTELGTLEKEGETNIDIIAGIFGKIMSILFVPNNDRWAASLSRIGFFLGKFIYILDAYDDLENDIKKKQYNAFKSVCNEDGFDDRIKDMLQMMMAECSREFEYLPVIENSEILRNILYAGVWTAYYRILEKRNKKDSSTTSNS